MTGYCSNCTNFNFIKHVLHFAICLLIVKFAFLIPALKHVLKVLYKDYNNYSNCMEILMLCMWMKFTQVYWVWKAGGVRTSGLVLVALVQDKSQNLKTKYWTNTQIFIDKRKHNLQGDMKCNISMTTQNQTANITNNQQRHKSHYKRNCEKH